MRILSITFFSEQEKGGGRTPAFAFQEYCKDYGVECDVLEIHQNAIATFEHINSYDAVFFATPPRKEINFNYTNLKIPFALMIHDETDLNKYPLFKDMVKMPNCKVLVHIDHDGNMYDGYHNKQIVWHPCCMPEILDFTNSTANENEGILYAGRIIEWKNPDICVDFANKTNNKLRMFGKNYTKSDYPIRGEYDSFIGLKRAGFADVFWDVCGNIKNKMLVKRMNLTAFEALHAGFMPIVDPESIPKHLRGIFIEYGKNEKIEEIDLKIKYYRRHKQGMFKEAIDKLESTEWNKYSIRERVYSIIEELIGVNKNKKTSVVSKILHESADLFESRNAEYGSAYKNHSKIMNVLFEGVELKTPEEFEMYHRIGAIVGKLNRYAKNFPHGHADSARDLVVYSAMLAELHHGE